MLKLTIGARTKHALQFEKESRRLKPGEREHYALNLSSQLSTAHRLTKMMANSLGQSCGGPNISTSTLPGYACFFYYAQAS